MIKKARVKLNPNEIEKKIKEDSLYKFNYLIENKESIEFIVPEITTLNRILFRNRPLMKVDAMGKVNSNGLLGDVKYFYIPKEKNDKLIKLYSDFKIPIEIQSDLTYMFLNMTLSSLDAKRTTKFYSDTAKKEKELYAIIDLAEDFAQKSKTISGITVEYKNTKKQKPFNDLKTVNVKGHMALQFIEIILRNYKNISDVTLHRSMYENNKKHGQSDFFNGHKNAEKHYQSIFSSAIYEYLSKVLFTSAFNYWDTENFNKELGKLTKMYTRNFRFLFIGKIMSLSGLLKIKEDSSKEEIIDLIKKKLTPKLKANKNHLNQIELNNQKIKKGQIEVIPFHELF